LSFVLNKIFLLQIADNHPLVSNKIPTTFLQNEYAADDKIYQDKLAVS
jgi:hypothetical protein